MIKGLNCGILVLAALTVASCGTVGRKLEDIQLSGEQNVGLCPNVFVLEDAARVVKFDGDPALENITWSAEILDIRSSCRYAADRPIRSTVEIDLEVGRGPAAQAHQASVEYFVAVTRKNKALIAKEVYAIPVQIKGNIATVRLTEDIKEIIIPRKDETTSGSNFEIAVGLALTPTEVIFNRSGQSLKFPNL